jgi:chemotaxis protein methyltransferase CheR
VTPDLRQVADVVRRETGISIRDVQMPLLEAALKRVAPAMDAAAFLEAGSDGIAPPALLDRLIDEVTVNETFFFRERQELEAIDWRLLHDAARAAGSERVRIWVAACASGEEAYTLGVLASEAFAPAEPPVSIVATDISLATLERAREGRYGRRQLRNLDDEMRGRYFVADGDGVLASDALRRLVAFERHNLARDPRPPAGHGQFELITCRNVLIYFDGEAVERVIGSLEGALAPQGMLVLGAADRLCGSARRLAALDESRGPQRRRPSARSVAKRVLRRPLGHDRDRAHVRAVQEPEAPAAGADLTSALTAANEGNLEATVEATASVLHDDPLNADAYFLRGLAELGLANADAAVTSLRRALYIDPSFALAAFELGHAHQERGDRTAAARAYEQALRTLDADDSRHDAILGQVDIGDVASACALRLKSLRSAVPVEGGRHRVAGGAP